MEKKLFVINFNYRRIEKFEFFYTIRISISVQNYFT